MNLMTLILIFYAQFSIVSGNYLGHNCVCMCISAEWLFVISNNLIVSICSIKFSWKRYEFRRNPISRCELIHVWIKVFILLDLIDICSIGWADSLDHEMEHLFIRFELQKSDHFKWNDWSKFTENAQLKFHGPHKNG